MLKFKENRALMNMEEAFGEITFTVVKVESTGRSKSRKKKGRPKKNGFCMYMEEQRPDILAKGHSLPRGSRDLAELVSETWKALSEEEKAKYNDLAKQANGRSVTKTQTQLPMNVQSSAAEEDLDELCGNDKNIMKIARCSVHAMFEGEDWIKEPIVICSFSSYFGPEYCDAHIPAEIGLTAMSLEQGVMDNFARIIDPGVIPKGHEEEVAKVVKKLGIPAIGTSPDFTDYDELMQIVRKFLMKYQGRLNQKRNEFCIFALDSDYVLVTRCLMWLLGKTGNQFSVKVLSLNRYAFLASSLQTRQAVSQNEHVDHGIEAIISEPSVIVQMSSYREKDKSLTGKFVYSPQCPLTRYGIFTCDSDVDYVIKQIDNYKYMDETCCIYHLKGGKEVQNCALNASNRYAYSILEILTLSSNIPISAGGHYPEISKPNIEKARRYIWLRTWGITAFELGMKDYGQEGVEQGDAIGPRQVMFKDLNSQKLNPAQCSSSSNDGGIKLKTKKIKKGKKSMNFPFSKLRLATIEEESDIDISTGAEGTNGMAAEVNISNDCGFKWYDAKDFSGEIPSIFR